MRRFRVFVALGGAILLLAAACGASATATTVPEEEPTALPGSLATLAPTSTALPVATMRATITSEPTIVTEPKPTTAPAATLVPTANRPATDTLVPTVTTAPTATAAPTASTPSTVAPTPTPVPTVVSIPTQAPEAPAVLSVIIAPSKDSSLFEHSQGLLGNGAGQHIFVGKTAQPAARRGVLAFDVFASIPQGSIITRVSLTMNMSQTAAATQSLQLHKLLADWSEGPSDAAGQEGRGTTAEAGDVTWLHTSFDSANWQSPGGDFATEPSAVQQVGDVGQYTWQSTDQIVADVQGWLDDPSANFGWLLLGNESVNKTTKRFDSKEHADEANRPALTIEYSSP